MARNRARKSEAGKSSDLPQENFRSDLRLSVVCAFIICCCEVLLVVQWQTLGPREWVSAFFAWSELVGQPGLDFVFGVLSVGLGIFLSVVFVGSSTAGGLGRWVIGEVVEKSRAIFLFLAILLFWSGGAIFLSILGRIFDTRGAGSGVEKIDVLAGMISLSSGYGLLLLGSRVVVAPDVAGDRIRLVEERQARVFRLAIWMGFPSAALCARSGLTEPLAEKLSRRLPFISGAAVGGSGSKRFSGVGRGGERSWLVGVGVWSWRIHVVLSFALSAVASIMGFHVHATLFFCGAGVGIGVFRPLDLVFRERVKSAIGLKGVSFGGGLRIIAGSSYWALVSALLLLSVASEQPRRDSVDHFPLWVLVMFVIGAVTCGVLILAHLVLFARSWSGLDVIKRLQDDWCRWEESEIGSEEAQDLLALERLMVSSRMRPRKVEQALVDAMKGLERDLSEWEREQDFGRFHEEGTGRGEA